MRSPIEIALEKAGLSIEGGKFPKEQRKVSDAARFLRFLGIEIDRMQDAIDQLRDRENQLLRELNDKDRQIQRLAAERIRERITEVCGVLGFTQEQRTPLLECLN